MVAIIPKRKREIEEGDTAFTFLFSQRKMAVVVTVVPLSTEVWISLTFISCAVVVGHFSSCRHRQWEKEK